MDKNAEPRVDDKPEAEEAPDKVDDLDVSEPEARKVSGAFKFGGPVLQ